MNCGNLQTEINLNVFFVWRTKKKSMAQRTSSLLYTLYGVCDSVLYLFQVHPTANKYDDKEKKSLGSNVFT